MLFLLLVSTLTLALNIQPVKSEPRTITVPDDYPTIQEAINNANEGDTVFVRNGTYYEHLNVNKTIELLGENRNATIIDGSSTGTVVLLRRDNITIQNFTIRNSGSAGVDSGIWVYHSVNNSKIVGNLVTNCCWAIRAENGAFNSTICDNIAERSYCGILLLVASNCRISSNILSRNNFCGVCLIDAAESNVSDNYISENGYLLSGYGIYVERGPINITNFVDRNSFIDNRQQAYCKPAPPEWGVLKVIWDNGYPSGGNYWSDYAALDLYSSPYQNVTGSDGIGDTPYIIDSSNRDNYPLMKPYPWARHDVGITSVTASKTIVGLGYNTSINIMIFNYGNHTENINITIYANTTIIGEINNIELTGRNFTIATFTWNTAGFAKGKYTIWAYATPVPDETDTADNTCIDGIVTIWTRRGGGSGRNALLL